MADDENLSFTQKLIKENGIIGQQPCADEPQKQEVEVEAQEVETQQQIQDEKVETQKEVETKEEEKIPLIEDKKEENEGFFSKIKKALGL